MVNTAREKTRVFIICMILSAIPVILSSGCRSHRVFKIGILSDPSWDAPVLAGFKKGISEQGYVEGENIRYFSGEIDSDNEQGTNDTIEKLLCEDIDILLITERDAFLRAREALKGTGTPILYCVDTFRVDTETAGSLEKTCVGFTGVRASNNVSKALEWMKSILVDTDKIYLPYNPDDRISMEELIEAEKAAYGLGIELVLHEVRSVEDSVEAIKGLSRDIDAIFMIPSPTLNPRSSELTRAAIKKGLPCGASISLDDDVMITFANNFIDAGKKTSWLACQILQGARPEDLPVEMMEVSLTVNLNTAEKIGVHIRDDMLAQVKRIIRD